MPLSGPEWAKQFPTSRHIHDLAHPFQNKVTLFVHALRLAGAHIHISATFRPPQRAYLMHYCFLIGRKDMDPRKVPPFKGVDIQWAHQNALGQFDALASKNAALQMVEAYQIVHKPVLCSRHSEGHAIDMTITWPHKLTITDAKGQKILIETLPHDGSGNAMLHDVGATYGVHKLLKDPPHWSSDGH